MVLKPHKLKERQTALRRDDDIPVPGTKRQRLRKQAFCFAGAAHTNARWWGLGLVVYRGSFEVFHYPPQRQSRSDPDKDGYQAR